MKFKLPYLSVFFLLWLPTYLFAADNGPLTFDVNDFRGKFNKRLDALNMQGMPMAPIQTVKSGDKTTFIYTIDNQLAVMIKTVTKKGLLDTISLIVRLPDTSSEKNLKSIHKRLQDTNKWLKTCSAFVSSLMWNKPNQEVINGLAYLGINPPYPFSSNNYGWDAGTYSFTMMNYSLTEAALIAIPIKK